MEPHPIQFRIEPTPRMDRTQVVVRLVFLAVLGTIGWSSLYWLLYLGVPALVAVRISQSVRPCLSEDGPRIVGILRWLDHRTSVRRDSDLRPSHFRVA